MRKLIDLTGKTFGLWKVIKRGNNNKWGQPQWYCKCFCGKEKDVDAKSLRGGDTLSCGCKWKEKTSLALTKHGHSTKGYKSKTYNSYCAMILRCYRKKQSNYKYYGGIGINVCDRWKSSFINFLEDMGERPNGTTLDRIDPHKDYELNNCRWADKSTQAKNKRISP